MYFVLLVIVGFVVGCSRSEPIASTEVENEIAVKISGSAATGYAIENAEWIIQSEAGDTLATGVTDSVGSINHLFDEGAVSEDAFLIITVDTDEKYRGISFKTGVNRYPVISPLSEYFTESFAKISQSGPAFVVPKIDSLVQLEKEMQLMLYGVDSGSVLRDSTFKPARKGVNKGEPSELDLFIHSVTEISSGTPLGRDSLFEVHRFGNGGDPLVQNRDMQRQYAQTVSLFEIPDDRREQYFDRFGEESQVGQYGEVMEMVRASRLLERYNGLLVRRDVEAVYLEVVNSAISILDKNRDMINDGEYWIHLGHVVNVAMHSMESDLDGLDVEALSAKQWSGLERYGHVLGIQVGRMLEVLTFAPLKVNPDSVDLLVHTLIVKLVLGSFDMDEYLESDFEKYLDEHLNKPTPQEIKEVLERIKIDGGAGPAPSSGGAQKNKPPHDEIPLEWERQLHK
ncbi:MAG: hypothetical protein OCD01_03330 [Fibrobacterales bacterium]